MSVFGSTLTSIYPMKMAKNSQVVIQIIQNQSPISFQLSMKNIITFCSIWTFFRYELVMDPGPKIKRSQFRSAPLFQKPFIIVSDYFLTLDIFLSVTSKEWKESIGFPDTELYTKYFEKNS